MPGAGGSGVNEVHLILKLKDIGITLNHRKNNTLFQQVMAVFVGLLLVLLQLIVVPFSTAQTRKRRRANKIEKKIVPEKGDLVERAIRTICEDRLRDPQGSLPIDEMAFARPLPLTDYRVLAGKSRAQSLLPVAKRLVSFALRRVAANNGLEPLSLRWVVARALAVNTIRAEVEERDNSSWDPSEPDAIIFGTVFLAGLRSDEAMLAVLAHELTHAIDGTDQALQPVFMRIGAKAAQIGRPIGAAAAAELVCEMVGMEVLRDYVSQTSRRGTTSRRLARALQKDCVLRDLADERHLSPRETMRFLLKTKPELAGAITGKSRGKQPRKAKARVRRSRS